MAALAPTLAFPVLRADVCLTLMSIGALVVLVWNHVRDVWQETAEESVVNGSDLASEDNEVEVDDTRYDDHQ